MPISPAVDRSSHRAATGPRHGVSTRPHLGECSSLTDLVSAAADGDAESWNEITRRFTNLLWAVARSYRLASTDAADVVQNTWLRLVENLHRVEHPEALAGWLATTARREALSVLRARSRLLPVGDPFFHGAADDAPELDDAVIKDERDGYLWECVAQLPERDQRLLRALMACDRPSYTAVAAALEMPVGSVGPTRMRALSRLRALIPESDYAFRDDRLRLRSVPRYHAPG